MRNPFNVPMQTASASSSPSNESTLLRVAPPGGRSLVHELREWWLCYFPVIVCPIVMCQVAKTMPSMGLLFALVVVRDHKRWSQPWGMILSSLTVFGCILASAYFGFRGLKL
jgi:hypothetical protein